MRVVRHLDDVPNIAPGGSVATLGNFDGVHLGHQAILGRVVEVAQTLGLPAIAITFQPHPAAVLAPAMAPSPILSLRERLDRLRDNQVDVVWVRRFTRSFSKIEPEEFIERFLIGWLGVRKVVIGHNVSFGRARSGNADRLIEAGHRKGFDVEVVAPVQIGDENVSSTRIREAVGAGNMPLASKLLGRPYGVMGRVVSGEQRGRGLGFPTANVRPSHPLLAPDGVYAVRVHHAEGDVPGIANIGHSPTFGEHRPRGVEAHLFGYEGNLYGSRIEVALVERIRAEKKFSSASELVEQIHRDVAQAQEILAFE